MPGQSCDPDLEELGENSEATALEEKLLGSLSQDVTALWNVMGPHRPKGATMRGEA